MIFVLAGALSMKAQDYLPEKPKVQTSVYDKAQFLSPDEAKRLEQKLINYSDTTSTQIVIVTINSLAGNDIAMYGTELAHKWGLVKKTKTTVFCYWFQKTIERFPSEQDMESSTC